MENSVQVRKKLSHLPLLRFTSVVIVLVALDSLVSVSLWIAGGDSMYMEDSVRDFSFTYSTFDLACMSAVRSVILIAGFYYLEKYTLLKVSVGEHDQQVVGCRMIILSQLLIFLVSGTSLVYATVKGSLILKSVLQGTWSGSDQELDMHITYKVLCIVSIVFPIIEISFCVISSWCLGRMIHTKRLRLLVNLEEDDDKQVAATQKADLKRIILLAKPVSILK